MIRLLSFSLAASIVIFTSSCYYDDDPDTSQTQRATRLAGTSELGKSWKIAAIVIDIGSVNPHRCVSDNNYLFYPSGSFEMNEGREKCKVNDPVGLTGSWTFEGRESQLVISIGDSTRTWAIEALTNQKLFITSDFNGDTRTYELVNQ